LGVLRHASVVGCQSWRCAGPGHGKLWLNVSDTVEPYRKFTAFIGNTRLVLRKNTEGVA